MSLLTMTTSENSIASVFDLVWVCRFHPFHEMGSIVRWLSFIACRDDNNRLLLWKIFGSGIEGLCYCLVAMSIGSSSQSLCQPFTCTGIRPLEN